MRRTKIVATLGPATHNPEILSGLISVGADVLRLNFSHGTRDDHARLVQMARKAAAQAGREVGILGDIPGPKLRLGDIEGGVMHLRNGQSLTLTANSGSSGRDTIPVGWEGLPEAVKRDDVIYLADGSIRLRVQDTGESHVLTRVETPGTVASHQGMNLPGVEALPAAVGESDLDWVDFACEQEIDLLAVSFVRHASDLDPVHARLAERGADIPVIAKIEKAEAAENAEEIVQACTGGIMVARGDLGIEVPIEEIPFIQKRLLALAGQYSKPCITATQMLASMVRSTRPTRAEATDVANAVWDGTDALMLSEETAIGQYPVDAVRMMSRIAEVTEQHLPYDEWLTKRTRHVGHDVADTVSYSAVVAAYQLDLAALVVPTRSGRTARLVAAHRPRIPVLALSERPATVRRLSLLFGVTSAHHQEAPTLDDLLTGCAVRARDLGLVRSGQLIGITAGLAGQGLGTNLLEVHRVP
ncbi:MAG TPA: pyruvate kinase [Solirubrobacterales bacterium]|nr:pyruvate kinase [Solirubrobacterales bacterium]